MNPDPLSTLYYLSITVIAIFPLLIYLLQLDVWPSPDKPRISLFFSIFGNMWLATNLSLAVYLSFTKPENLFFVGFIWKMAVALLFLTGISISLWAWRLFKTIKRVLGAEMDILVTGGPYRYTRHPQYFSVMLMTIGLAIFFNTLQLSLFTVTTTAAFYIAALLEEKKLEKMFGQRYMKYKKETPFIPLLRIKRTKTKLEKERKFRFSKYILKYLPEGMHGWLAGLYDREIARPLLQEFYEDVAKYVTRKMNSGRILDLGTGPGYLPIRVVEKSPNTDVVGIDISKKMVEIARANVIKKGVLDRVNVVYGDGNNLPFRNDSYEMVISTGVLFTSPNPTRILNECYRVLKNGEEAWIIDFRRDLSKKEIKHIKEELTKRGMSWLGRLLTIYAIPMAYTIEELSKIVDETMFDYEIEPYGLWSIKGGMRVKLNKSCVENTYRLKRRYGL